MGANPHLWAGAGQARIFLRSRRPRPVNRKPARTVPVTANPVIGKVFPVDCAAVVFELGLVVVAGVVVAGVVEVGVVAGVVDVVFASTTTVPCMNGWIEQM